eukprot:scaffold289148_cov26-Tisochrysis_lutea.AAC.1
MKARWTGKGRERPFGAQESLIVPRALPRTGVGKAASESEGTQQWDTSRASAAHVSLSWNAVPTRRRNSEDVESRGGVSSSEVLSAPASASIGEASSLLRHSTSRLPWRDGLADTKGEMLVEGGGTGVSADVTTLNGADLPLRTLWRTRPSSD